MTSYSRISALGSSYASGPGIQPVADKAAGRSECNYPSLLARGLKAQLADLTVSGATTDTILETSQRVLFKRYAPQITGLPSDSDLVTVTAAGNDLQYISTVLKLGLVAAADNRMHGALSGIRRRIGEDASHLPPERLNSARTGLTRIVEEVRIAAPSARVVLVDYLPLFGQSTRPEVDVPFTNSEIESLSDIAAHLAAVFREVATELECDLVAASQLGRGHELGSPAPWVQPLYPVYRLTGSYHPNLDGMRAIAQEIERLLVSPATPGRG